MRPLSVLVVVVGCHASSPAVDLAAGLAPGEVRAGRTTSGDQLVGGVHSGARVGDYKIFNDRVRFIVSAPGPAADGYDPYGGRLVAADRVRPGGEPDASTYGEMIPVMQLRTLRTVSVEVLADGTGGGPARLRATGPDDVFPLLDSLALGNAVPLGADIVIDYTLEPGADYLTMDVGLKNTGAAPVSVGENWAGYVMGHGARSFLPGYGFTFPTVPAAIPYYATETDRLTYSFFAPAADFSPIFGYQGFLAGDYGPLSVPPGRTGGYRVYLVVGPGDLAFNVRVHERLAAHDGLPLGLHHASGTVADAGGRPLAGARVHAVRTDAPDPHRAYALFARTAADGAFDLPLAPGRYELTAVADGRDPSPPLPVDLRAADAPGLSLPLGATATLDLTAVDEKQIALPVKFVVSRSGGPELPAMFGEDGFQSGGAHTTFAVDGHARVAVAPGTWHVVASRGLEYELAEGDVAALPGAVTTWSGAVRRVVDTSGWLSGDFHLHGVWSPDSNDAYELKVAACAAEGLEVPVATEHEFIGDYGPTVRALGLASRLHPIRGEEISTVTFGHFNAFPLEPDPVRWNAGAFVWYGLAIPDLFAQVRAAAPKAVLQVNHPRSKGKAYFDAVALAGGTSPSRDWTPAFDAVELINGQRGDEGAWADWTALLGQGHRITATGDSDSHHAIDSEVGLPRNYVKSTTDDPSSLDEAEFADNVRRGHLVIGGGPFLEVSSGGAGPGDLVKAASGAVAVHVRVQAPLWMGPLSRVVFTLAGVEVAHVDLSRAPADRVLRYEGDVSVPVAHDAALVVKVEGGDVSKVYPSGHAGYAIANPLYVDADGDGAFSP